MADELLGKRFGRLVVKEQVAPYISPSGGKHIRLLCVCDCGNEAIVLKEHLTSGGQKSCGCLRKENGVRTHGGINTRLYTIWGNMCNRCSNPNNPVWERYGGRGIAVFDEWKSFENFRDWSKDNGYAKSLTIDRIDNDGGYNPTNCRWVDSFVQANNKSNNRLVGYNGVTKTISEWATYLSMPYKTLYHRIVDMRWSVDRAFTQHIRSASKSQSANI